MSEPWPGRVVDAPESRWPGTVVAPTPTASPRRRRTIFGARPSTPAPLDSATATDGDTIRSGDLRVRLWGVDAPELNQPGFDRQGNAVSIGQASRDYLQGQISDARTARLDDVAGMSWGRPVGPVSLDGRDAGLGSIRSGNALAAPDYLESDPNRRFDYMQAERLARVNQLGPMNDTMAQNPADFRKGIAPRQTVAQFWDTPTPFQGMRPEAEKQYLQLLDSAPAAEIAAFAESQGLSLDPEYLASWVEDRDERKAKGLPYTVAARYSETPLATHELGDGAIGAGVRGYGEGFVAGALGELGAVADTLGGTQGRENIWNSDRRLADIWANNEYQNAAILRGDEVAHPTASMVGQIGGALTSGFVIPYGQGARTVPQLARVGALYGGTEGFMGTDGTVPQRLTGAAIGAPAGAIINAAGGKALEAAAPLLGRAAGAVRGRLGREASPTAIAAAETAGDVSDWPGRVIDERAMAMDAAPDPSLSAPVRQRDYIDLPPVRPARLADPLDDAQRMAAAENVQSQDVLPHAPDQPLPAVQPHEEWSDEAIQRVGNIDVTKLDTPQDIRRALKTSSDMLGGFDAATRGRITQAETERLASEMGMTADQLLSRRKGDAFNAEEALAARQILAKSGNELVNFARRIQRLERPGDAEAAAFKRALTRHAAIQEQVAGMTAEAGRTLQQFRMLANSRAMPGEVLSSMADLGGGEKHIKNAADILLDAVEDGPGRFNTVARKVNDPRFRDKLAELFINQILSGPQTHVVNAIGNTLTALGQLPENVVASAIGGARRAAAREEIDRVMAGEVGARLFGLVQGTKEGARFAAQALKTGETSDTFSKIAGHDMRAISGLKGEIIRVPGRLLNSADELFKGMSRRAELNALAYRKAHKEGLKGQALRDRIAQLSANPTEDMELQALDFARYMTFQRPLSGVSQNISRMVRDHPEFRPIITFIRTPTNLLKFAAERSPAAPILKEWRADFKAGGARRDMAMARALLGTGFAYTMFEAAKNGLITGSAPSDPAKNRYLRANGWQPYSVKVGDKWISYARLDPFSTTISVAADLATKAEGMTDRQLENYSGLLVASIMSSLGDKVWLSGISDFTNALSDPQRYMGSYLRRLGASFAVPNLSFQTARTIDPVARERDTFGEELQARIPGLSDNLLPRRDIWGSPITNEGGVGPDWLSPIWQSTERNDPVNREMLAIDARNGPPSRYYTVDGVKNEWTPEQYDRLQALSGPAAHSGVMELVASPSWRSMDDDAKRKAVDKVFRTARENAKAQILTGAPAPEGADWPGTIVEPDGGDELWPGTPVANSPGASPS
ncbi:thermonuclease family protein [Pelagerythrobacter aerophilus]